MSILLNLPEDIGVFFLNEWCDLTVVALLDTALTVRTTRQQFLLMMQKLSVDTLNCNRGLNFFKWCFIRRLRLVKLRVTSSIVSEGNLKVEIQTESITHVQLQENEVDFTVLNKLFGSCPRLVSISLGDVDSVELVDPCVLQRLTEFDVGDGAINVDYLLESIQNHCKDLEVFKLGADSSGLELLLLQMMKSNPNLREVCFSSDLSLLSEIVSYCPLIESISVIAVDFAVQPIIDVLIRKPGIKDFVVFCDDQSFRFRNYVDNQGTLIKSVELSVSEEPFNEVELTRLLAMISDVNEFRFTSEYFEDAELFPREVVLFWLGLNKSTLTRLSLKAVTGDDLEVVLSQCPHITDLELVATADDTFYVLQSLGGKLTHLAIRSADLTYDATLAILEAGRSLKKVFFSFHGNKPEMLVLTGCKKITAASHINFVKYCVDFIMGGVNNEGQTQTYENGELKNGWN